MKTQLVWLAVITPLLSEWSFADGESKGGAPEASERALRPFLEEYCVKCHGGDGEVKGDLDLRRLLSGAELLAQPKLLSKMVEAVRDEEMPPEKAKHPEAAKRAEFLAQLGGLLEESLRAHAVPARTPVRRMNRFQYSNAVRDLLDLKVELYALPEMIVRDIWGYFAPQTGKMPERVGVGNRILGKSQRIAPRLSGVVSFPQDLRAPNGFDNRGDLLTLSPVLMESFLELSQSIFQSSDFNPKNCGKWGAYFEAPPASEPMGEAVRNRLRDFLTRAFRRPVDEETVGRYAAMVLGQLDAGESFTNAMKAAAGAVLASPRFLYLYDGGTTGKVPEAVDDFELASRLSFFLWGSGPDEELLREAAQARLRDPKVLEAQADRMMNDPRMKRFCDAFASQWLKMENLVSCEPDRKKFPDFYKFGIVSHAKFGSVHMMLEPLLLFETVFVENRSITDFIHSDFTYRSEQLRQFIGREATIANYLSGPNWSETCVFERVPVNDKREGGVITTCAVMTMTSSATTPKPIARGKWVIETLFNDPPPPPPAKVPELEEAVTDKVQKKALTLREQFALHRTDADCASCHVKIDAFGFALENYDAVGRWRDQDENGNPIDASGKLFNRLAFGSVEEFKGALLEEKDRFARGLAGHLLKYGLGRELAPSDQPAIRRIVVASAEDGYRLRGMMKQVILSEPFRVKFNPVEALSQSQR
ncbi:MAG: hypothetical protein RLZZ399_2751 [Verrucomicrobiota bacterium]|jgi:hypothetical protein